MFPEVHAWQMFEDINVKSPKDFETGLSCWVVKYRSTSVVFLYFPVKPDCF